MSKLISDQLFIIAVMTACGLVASLIRQVFEIFESRRIKNFFAKGLTEIFSYIVMGFAVSEFLFFCDKGRLSLLSASAFTVGCLLWKKYFYAIINSGDTYDKKGKSPSDL